MPYFTYQSIFPLGADTSEYRLLTRDYVDWVQLNGYALLKVSPEGLRLLAEAAFTDVAHLYRSSHLAQLQRIHDDPDSSDNDRFVSLELLKNAVISAEGIFPMCQDTGTALIMGKKGQQVWTGGGDEAALSKGVFDAYTQNNLRYSQNAPISMFDEVNTGCNLPAQIDIQAVDGEAYGFLFIAKGGGSANKTFLYQETKTILKPDKLLNFIKEKLKALGTAACPPYHLALVVGGLSAEMTLKTVKLASAGYLDGLPIRGNENGHAFRDPEIEKQVLQMAMETGIGAQFGGKYFCHDVRVIRLPRHGASCPIGLGVSCSADRNIKAKITRKGIFLEKLETDPARFLPAKATPWETGAVPIDLNRSMGAIRAELSKHPVGTRLLLNGPITVARDIAHARLKDLLDSGKDLPQYVKDHLIYCAGPAKTPPGYASGSFGPTTASRMDTYVPLFQENGASLVMLAKGNRSRLVTDACRKNGGFYLGAVGGPAARIGKACITHMETLAYPELGMEAIFRITVKNFPALILVDDKGNDFFSGLLP